MNGLNSAFLGFFMAIWLVLSVATITSLVPKAEAATNVISSNTTMDATTINAGDKLIINPGVTVTLSGILTNNGSILNNGTIIAGTSQGIRNYGILLNLAGGTIRADPGNYSAATLINYESGLVKDDAMADASTLYNWMNFDNYGTHTSHAGFSLQAYSVYGNYRNFATGTLESFKSPGISALYNYGGLVTFHDGAHLRQAPNVGGGYLFTNGTINNYGLLSVSNIYPGAYIIAENGILNNFEGAVIETSIRVGSATVTTIEGTLNNHGSFINKGVMNNSGTFTNDGILQNLLNPVGGVLAPFVDNSGKFNNGVNGNVTNFSVINNLASGAIRNAGLITNKCNADFNNSGAYTGNPIVNECATYPVPPISDMTPQEALTIKSVNLDGESLNGLWTVIRSTDGTVLKTGYTPLTFTGDAGTYTVSVANYDGKVFRVWEDGSMSSTRTIALSADTAITATYDAGRALRGFTSLTYAGTEEQPDLTVNALSNDGNKTLHMWAIIDPQSNDTNSTTYRVYATNGYQNLRFDHWDDGSTNRVRTLSIEESHTITAYYNTG